MKLIIVLAVVIAAAIAAPAISQQDEEGDAFIPATAAEQQELVERLRPLVECARAAGADVPDPVAVPTGAIIPWPGNRPNARDVEAMRRCEDFHVP